MEITHNDIEPLASMIANQVAAVILAQETTGRWLKLKEAALYSSIGRKRLVQLAENGKVTGFQDPDSGRGDWIFDRQSLDDYRLMQSSELRMKALDLFNRV
jgi:hypothetical protein